MDTFWLLIKCFIGLFLLGQVIAWITRWGQDYPLDELLENRKHNAKINKKWREDGYPVIQTTVGWRPDPVNKADGYRDDGFDKNIAGDGHSYSKLIRGGTKKYREKYEQDVRDSSK